MKHLLLIVLSDFLLSFIVVAQKCDCDLYPISKECRTICGMNLLQHGTAEQLKKNLGLGDSTAKKITNSPGRNTKTRIEDYQDILPYRNYLELKEKYNAWTNSPVITQYNNSGDNVGGDKYVTNNSYFKSDSTRQLTDLQYHTSGIENINFLYNTQNWEFNADSLGEDIMNQINPYDTRYGLVTEFPFKTSFPRIPAGYMYINFTIENHGNTLLVLDRIELQILNTYPIPPSARFNLYKPILKPEQDIVFIKPNQSTYSIFKSKIYKYAPGEIDLFRIKVELSKEMEPRIYEYKVVAHYRNGNDKLELTSDRSYFLASPIKVTSEQQTQWEQEFKASIDNMNVDIPSFYDINGKIQADSFLTAKNLLDSRIEKMLELKKYRLAIKDSGPGLADCIIFRLFLTTYMNDDKTYIRDISYLKDNYNVELDKPIDEFKEQLMTKSDDSREFIKELSFKIRGRKSDGNLKMFYKIYDMDLNPVLGTLKKNK